MSKKSVNTGLGCDDVAVLSQKIDALDKKIQVSIAVNVLSVILFAICLPFFMQYKSMFSYGLYLTVMCILMYLMFSSVFIKHDVNYFKRKVVSSEP